METRFTHTKVKWTWVASCTLDAQSNPDRAPCGICTGDQGASRACPYGARSNLGARPVKSRDRPRTGFDRALRAFPVKSRRGPSRGRYLGNASQTYKVVHKICPPKGADRQSVIVTE